MAPPIQPLPNSDIRFIDSEQILTGPRALVKELVDNSIDAQAAAIDVLVSSDAISKIEVRDNGTGIDPDDYERLGRPGHTSKIRALDDLTFFSGATLGFRGQALAAAVNLAGVTITTKTIDEPVATEIVLNPGVGGVKSRTPVSGPLGTTVVVTGLFKSQPVRARVVQAESTKHISAMKNYLIRTAMARPQLKLSLRIYQNIGSTWSHPSNKTGTMKPTIIGILGHDVANACFETSLTASMSSLTELDVPHRIYSPGDNHHSEKFSYEAVLAKPEADVAKISNKGTYVSVDSRPLCHTKGTTRKIAKIYRDALTKNFGEHAIKLKEPFLLLNIKCPKGSYDPNIEPAKDDVVFSYESDILLLFSRLCSNAYGEALHRTKEDTGRTQADRETEGIGSMLVTSTSSPGMYFRQQFFSPRIVADTT